MNNGYFHRVNRLTQNRMWINNPTSREAVLAIDAGAINCTTNPTYASKQLISDSDRELTLAAIDEAIKMTEDDSEAAAIVQRKLVKRLMDIFLPLYQKKPGEWGMVSIQGNPHTEENPDSIVKEALEDVKLGPNPIAKIPVTDSGLKAIEYLVTKDVPIIATEIMSISQAVHVCEVYKKASSRSGKNPPLFVTHITGIFDQYLAELVKRENISIEKDLLWQAGCIVARKQYKLMKERQYPGIMLGGGARDLHHFTEMIGSDMHVTINWKGTADKLIENDPPVVYRMDAPVPKHIVDELSAKIPDFVRAYEEDALSVSEFMDFGPVAFFRNMFIKGWDEVTAAICERRKSI